MADPKNLEKFPVPTVNDTAIYDMAFGIVGVQAAMVALDLGVFDLLEKGPADLDTIAGRFNLAPRSTRAMLDACVALKLVERDGDRYELSALSTAYLTPDSPTYMGDYLRAANITQPDLTAFSTVRRSIVENRTQIYDGKDLFETNAAAMERARVFTLMMHGHSISSALTWPTKFDLSQTKRMIDIGGGSGAHAIGAALRWPELTAEVFEIPSVVPVAEEFIERYGVTGQVTARGGDFWNDPLPEGDLHFYGDTLHDWPDDKCRALLLKSFEALEPGGQVMIHEILYDDDKSGPLVAASFSVVMLAWTEGHQRTAAEYEQLLTEIGFADARVDPAFGYWQIVSARKPG